MDSIYDFTVKASSGELISLAKFRGKAMLIVNTASKCGFTPQYKGLQELYQARKDQLEVLAFPCNQFGKQEPGSDDEIARFCELNFKIDFPLFSKIEVNGPGTHPLYAFLKEALPGMAGTKRIKWNFTKFLVDSEGKPVKRYSSFTAPKKIAPDLERLL